MKKKMIKKVALLITACIMLVHVFLSVFPEAILATTTNDYEPTADNLALNVPVEYSSQWTSGAPAVRAVDGDLDTFWRNLSSDTKFPWLSADLGEGAIFDRIKLITYVKSGNEMKDFKIEYSNDKENWTELPLTIDKEINDKTEFEFKFEPLEARYIKFTNELGAIGHTVGLYEMEVFKPYIPVESITLNRSEVGLLVGDTIDLKPIVTPVNADRQIKWESTDESVATVDQNGNVAAIGLGEATISVVNDYNKKLAKTTITVFEESNAIKNLLSFKFTTEDNPDLDSDIIAEVNQTTNIISLELPDVDIKTLIPTFKSNGKAVGIDGYLQVSSETPADFSAPITYEVYGEDNTIKNYVVDAVVNSNGRDLSYQKPVSINHEEDINSPARFAVDGNMITPYKSLGSEYNAEAPEPTWLTVDMGTKYTFDRVHMNLYNAKNILDYKIQYSNDNENWIDIYEKEAKVIETPERPNGDFTSEQFAMFSEPVTARYIRYNQMLIPGINENLVGGLNNFSVYSGEPHPELVSAKLVLNNGEVVSENGDIKITSLGDEMEFEVKALLTDNSEDIVSNVEIKANKSDAVRLETTSENTFKVTANEYSLVKLAVEVTHGPKMGPKTLVFNFFLDIVDPEKLVVDLALLQDKEEYEIGVPAIVNMKGKAPKISLYSYYDGRLSGNVQLNGKEVSTFQRTIKASKDHNIPLSINTKKSGLYKINVTLSRKGKEDFNETLYFTVVDPNQKKENESYAAYLGEDGKLIYTPDFRGNNIIDFSNSGYKGGGVAIPSDIPIKVVVEPVEGDDTENIQNAIDEVEALDLDENGFRGVVLLKEGTYDISGTLQIKESGVVLRGSGQGEKGTLLFATGSKRSFLLEVGAGITTETDIQAEVTDNYIPVGSRTFTVDDPSQFEEGDSIFLYREGNERWIHEIDMDQIPEREGTVQWTPFDIKMDRVITNIEGNTITIDAPITNAIETRWGGAYIVKYEDTRISNIGVENLMVDVDVKWDKDTSFDRYGFKYSKNEDQIQSFVKLSNVKDAWVRNTTSYHLVYALVNVMDSAKWVTIQDSSIYEMSGQITGSRRYGINLDGQMALVQRVHIETARHSYTVQSRKAGPRVFLDSVGLYEHTNSEPHQRYSTGGLFDNVKGDITIKDRGNMGTGHGWAGANYTAWNTEGYLHVEKAPTATNYAIGAVGVKEESDKDGFWDSVGTHVNPRSLYLQQLEDRLGIEAVENIMNVAEIFKGQVSIEANE